MKEMVAVYRTKRGGKLNHVVDTFETKKAFQADLKANGLIVVYIYTMDQVEDIASTKPCVSDGYATEYIRQVFKPIIEAAKEIAASEQPCTQKETIDAQPTTKDIEVQETVETAKELDVVPHKAVMTYKEAKEYKQQLEEINDNNSKVLNSFEKNSMGFSPDHIRELPEYKKAKENYDKSFSQLRDFNAFFVKKFKKEYAADRKNRYKTK